MSNSENPGPGTRLIHAGEPDPRIEGAVSMPVFQSSTFAFPGSDGKAELRYIRLNNTPNHKALHTKLAAVENGETALVTASGMAAISTSLLSFLGKGDHLLAQRSLYGGTHAFITQDLERFGIEYDLFDGTDSTSWESMVRPDTKVIYSETISNPLLEVIDFQSVVQFAQTYGLISIIDNTFASPINFRPLEHGFDISIHSGSKYLNGHTDLVAGAVIGGEEHIERIAELLLHLGGTLDPHACFLLHRGLKTLAVRMEHHNRSALAIARFLEIHPAIRRVCYPGLASHPTHNWAHEMFTGYGGMVSIDLSGGAEAAMGFLNRLKIAVVAPSLGGVETLVSRPVETSHAGLSSEERESIGITDGLIRLSIGLEDTDDLIEDFTQALG